MNKINRVLAAVFFVLAILLYLITPSQVSQASSTASSLRADFFPRLVAILMLVSSIGLFVQSHIAIKGGYKIEDDPDIDWKRELKVGAVFVMIIAYVYAMRAFGFILSSTAFGMVLLHFLGGAKRWHYLAYIVGVVLVYFVFSDYLYVWLPTLGVWIL